MNTRFLIKWSISVCIIIVIAHFHNSVSVFQKCLWACSCFHECVCVCSELLKRVDDSSEDVRVEALKSLSTWFSSLGKNYDSQSCRPHLEFLFQQLLLYMDDPDTKIQDSVLGKGLFWQPYFISAVIICCFDLNCDWWRLYLCQHCCDVR